MSVTWQVAPRSSGALLSSAGPEVVGVGSVVVSSSQLLVDLWRPPSWPRRAKRSGRPLLLRLPPRGGPYSNQGRPSHAAEIVRLRGQNARLGNGAARSGIPSPHGIAPERAASQQRVAVTTQLAPRLPAAVGSAASEVMMLGSGEFVMLLLRCCLLLMLWLLMLLLLLRPRGRTGARPMRASSPSVGANSIISSRRNVLLGCTECAVRALSEKVRGGCVHSL